MELKIKRDTFDAFFTLGKFYINESFIGYTCEDADRHLEDGKTEKIYGKSAIPRGRYRVVISYSNRFKRDMPEVLDVPGFSGIRIHGGNTAADTLGCPLLGSNRTMVGVAGCSAPNTILMQFLEMAASKNEDVYLTVE